MQYRRWWESPWFMVALVVLMTVPLLGPSLPPLVDVPGHMGRYRVMLDLDHSASLQRYYSFEWLLVGNLGADLLVLGLEPIFGLELAVKLIAIAIPAITAGGLLVVARMIHGRLPPTAPLALAFCYGFPFQYGFLNFCLSAGLALFALALWYRLGVLQRFRTRAAVFVPISIVLWLAHITGLGIFGLLAFATEVTRQRAEGRRWIRACLRTAVHLLPLTLPLILTVVWSAGRPAAPTGDWFEMKWKYLWVYMTLRDRFEAFDTGYLWICLVLVFGGLASRKLRMSTALGIGAGLLLLSFVLTPGRLIGSQYADMRLTPYVFAVAVLAVGFAPEISARTLNAVAAGAVALLVARVTVTTGGYLRHAETMTRALGALPHVPIGARLVSFAARPCKDPWSFNRLPHLPGMAIVRREAFSNETFPQVGAPMLTVKYRPVGFYQDPSQLVTIGRCSYQKLDDALMRLPRYAFDYLWLLETPMPNPALLAGMTELWRDGASALYRIEHEPPPR